MQIGLNEAIQVASRNGGLLPKGTVICEGTIDSGDLVLVDKFSYHFRKPKRGEVFVFDTLGIRGIHERSGEQAAGSHYIKRLSGVPGDTLSIQPPNLLVDGKISKEPGNQRVIHGKGPVFDQSRTAINSPTRARRTTAAKSIHQYLAKPDRHAVPERRRPRPECVNMPRSETTPATRWTPVTGAPVKEFNLVGPALFSLWPVTTGHWGFIH